MSTALTRRHLLAGALATGVAIPLGSAGVAQAAPGRLTLPKPTGPHHVGTVPLHLTGARELMAGIWYPAAARDVRRYPLAPWMPVAPMRALLESAGFPAEAAVPPQTAGHIGAPALSGARLPVVLFSHGSAGHRAETTIIVQELASRGYVVVTVDHAGDAYSEFPDGRLIVPTESFTPWDYANDIRLVIDRIEDFAAGRLPLPVANLAAALDPRRIGMFGWSKGATATALVMNTDRRVRAGLSLDGPMQSNPGPAGLGRPFMLMTGESTRANEESVERFWWHLRGWRLNIQAAGAGHRGYCDYQWMIPQLAKIVGMSDEELAGWVSFLKPTRAVRIQQAYPLAFFDKHLLDRPSDLLRGPSAAFPEVQFVR